MKRRDTTASIDEQWDADNKSFLWGGATCRDCGKVVRGFILWAALFMALHEHR